MSCIRIMLKSIILLRTTNNDFNILLFPHCSFLLISQSKCLVSICCAKFSNLAPMLYASYGLQKKRILAGWRLPCLQSFPSEAKLSLGRILNCLGLLAYYNNKYTRLRLIALTCANIKCLKC